MARTLSLFGMELARPKAAFFEFTSCEGCQLELVNREERLPLFLDLLEIVQFREIMDEQGDDFEIVFVEGAVSRRDEIRRLKAIRRQAQTLVALGSCACFGGVNRLKNRFADQGWVQRTVYGDHPVETMEVTPLADHVRVDLEIYGCPVRKEEVEKIVASLVAGKTVRHPQYPVCMECKAREEVCLFELGEPCLGPVTRAGCDAWCPANRRGCWGCRGPAEAANLEQMARTMERYGFSDETLLDRLECFGGFPRAAQAIRRHG